MLLIDAPNIFQGAGNDYNIRVMKCKQTNSSDHFIEQVAKIITDETGYNPLSRVKFRGRKFVESRQIMATILSDHTKLTQIVIGKLSGGKDHSTVVHSKKTIDDLCETDYLFKEMYNRIDVKVKAIR